MTTSPATWRQCWSEPSSWVTLPTTSRNSRTASPARLGYRGATPSIVLWNCFSKKAAQPCCCTHSKNYSAGNLDVVYQMLTNRNTVCGIADGGAHVGLICDSGSPTNLLTLWARDRTRGPRLPLE